MMFLTVVISSAVAFLAPFIATVAVVASVVGDGKAKCK